MCCAGAFLFLRSGRYNLSPPPLKPGMSPIWCGVMPCRAILDIETDIDDVRSAIKAARQGQSYSFGGRSVTRADYRALRDELAELYAELDAATAAARGIAGVLGIPCARRL